MIDLLVDNSETFALSAVAWLERMGYRKYLFVEEVAAARSVVASRAKSMLPLICSNGSTLMTTTGS